MMANARFQKQALLPPRSPFPAAVGRRVAVAARRAGPDRAAAGRAPPARPPAHVVGERPHRRAAVVAGRPARRARRRRGRTAAPATAGRPATPSRCSTAVPPPPRLACTTMCSME